MEAMSEWKYRFVKFKEKLCPDSITECVFAKTSRLRATKTSGVKSRSCGSPEQNYRATPEDS